MYVTSYNKECVMSSNLLHEIEKHLFKIDDDALMVLLGTTLRSGNMECYILVKKEILARLGQLFG